MKKFLFVLICNISLFANPTLPNVDSGNVVVNSNNNELIIEASDRAVIHWENFSIGENELTRFIQPSASAWVINKVIGTEKSVLLGSLQANGQVLLINPHGIYCGKDAILDCASFWATTLNMEGELKDTEIFFSGDSKASIVNMGTVKAKNGNVVFIAHQVTNEGTITAPDGKVILASVNECFLNPEDKKNIFIKTNVEGSDNFVLNKGLLAAIDVQLQSSGNAYEFAIRNEGEIDATGLFEHEGKVLLLAEEGTVINSGKIVACNKDETGGKVHILGKRIGLIDEAMVDVSADKGLGEILIGGGRQGSDPNLSNSECTFVGEKALLKANANKDGDGGQIIMWSDGVTGFLGNCEVKGGKEGGDGGFVEVSGKQVVDFKGIADRSAPHGKAGTLSLDPESDIVIGPNPDGGGTWVGLNFVPNSPASSVLVSYLPLSQLLTNLALGNVTITTSYSGGGPSGNGTITLQPIFAPPFYMVYNSPHTLTLHAAGRNGSGDAIINHSLVLNSGSGDIFLQAPNGNIRIESPLGTGYSTGFLSSLGNISVSAGGGLYMASGDFLSISHNGNAQLSALRVDIDIGGDLEMHTVRPGAGTVIASFHHTGALETRHIYCGGRILLFAGPTASITNATAIYTIMDNLDVRAQNDIEMIGYTSSNFCRLYSVGDLSVTSVNGSITLRERAHLHVSSLGGATNHNALLIAGQNIHLYNQSLITNQQPNGELTLVVDNLFPSAPDIGPGFLLIDPLARLSTASPSTPLRIFTSVPTATTINGFINGVRYTPGSIGVNTNFERWGFWYPNSFWGGNFYTIFYKLATSNIYPYPMLAFYEMLGNLLNPFDEYLYLRDKIFFKTKYAETEYVPFNDRFFLPKTYYHNVRQSQLVQEPDISAEPDFQERDKQRELH